MPVDTGKIEALVLVFSDGDAKQCAESRSRLRAIGKAALAHLEMLRFRQEGNAYTEIFRTLIDIGDDVFEKEGAEGLSEQFIKTIKSGAKKTRPYAADEVQTLCIDALLRWGFDVPPVLEQTVYTCHVCGRNSTDLRVRVCSLHTCDAAVCKDHAHVIETRFGLFDGSGGAWFCAEAHHTHANHNHIDWN
jgi:hypothetical protein